VSQETNSDSDGIHTHRERLNELIKAARMAPLTETEAEQFSAYLELFLRWNERINLSAIRDAESILSRHFLESILCARALPAPIAILLDYGSGGGLPGVPIAILNPEVHVTLAESQSKKAAFLSEVVRALSLNAKVHSSRAELLQTKFDCVTLRAVDKMAEAVQSASTLVALNGWLVLMTTSTDSSALTTAAGDLYEWSTPQSLPGADLRIILIGQKSKP
jgi:16S rRNA (guanine527-N7)-methyltransferase